MYTLTYDINGKLTAVSKYNEMPPGGLAAGEYEASEEQFNNPLAWIPSNGVLVKSADADKLIKAAKLKASENAIQKMLDDAAKARGYDNIVTASSYASLPSGEPFQAEGAEFNLWRAKCWAKAYEILAAVEAGLRAEPTIDELLAEMPALVLP
jgi:hypothetical protein